MICNSSFMPRKRRSYILDERVIEAIAELAAKQHMSANRYLEKLTFTHGKQLGVIPMDAEPLKETRGGDRTTAEKQS